jgi:hypothetical protein
MTELSPQAQAVFSAWAKPVDIDRSLVVNGQALEAQARGALAAALQAAADQVVPEEDPPADFLDHPVAAEIEQRQSTRAELLAIAAELEGSD